MTNLNNDVLCRQILTLAPDAILFADQHGIIRLWNHGAERIFGCSANDAIGQSLDLIIPEKLRKRHWDGYRKTMETGETRYSIDLLAVPAMHQNGSRLSTEFSIVMLNDDDGKPIGVAAILRDVTERHNKEKRMLDRLADLESAHET